MDFDQLSQKIAAAGLSEFTQQILDEVKTAIPITLQLVEDESELESGISKFGGNPDLPVDFEWPYWNEVPLTFMTQFRMEDVAAYDLEHALPSSGIFSFFYEADSQAYGAPEHRGANRVYNPRTQTS